MLLERISLTLFCHSSLSSIISSRSSWLYLCPYRAVLIGHRTLEHPYKGVHWRTSLMSLSLLLHQCLTCLVRLIWIVLEMEDRWLYSCCFVGCCFQDLFSVAPSILVEFLLSFFYICFVSIHVVHPYSRIDTTAAWKKMCFILLDKSDFHMIDNQSIAVHTFTSCILISFSVDETLLLRYGNLSTSFREPPYLLFD